MINPKRAAGRRSSTLITLGGWMVKGANLTVCGQIHRRVAGGRCSIFIILKGAAGGRSSTLTNPRGMASGRSSTMINPKRELGGRSFTLIIMGGWLVQGAPP